MKLEDHYLKKPMYGKLTAAFATLSPHEQFCYRSLSSTRLRSAGDLWHFVTATPPNGTAWAENDVELALCVLARNGFATLVEGDWLTREINGWKT